MHYAGGVVYSLEPWTKGDLVSKKLVERIKDLAAQIGFSYIYPDHPPSMLDSPSEAPPSLAASLPMKDEQVVPVTRSYPYVKVVSRLLLPPN